MLKNNYNFKVTRVANNNPNSQLRLGIEESSHLKRTNGMENDKNDKNDKNEKSNKLVGESQKQQQQGEGGTKITEKHGCKRRRHKRMVKMNKLRKHHKVKE